MKKRLAIAAVALAVIAAPYGAGALQVSAAASGNNTVSADTTNTTEVETPEQAGYRMLEEGFTAMVAFAPEGSTVEIKKEDNIQTLSAAMLFQLASRGTVSLHMEYTYMGVDYSITIPAGGVQFEPGVYWYGPLWLAAHYAN